MPPWVAFAGALLAAVLGGCTIAASDLGLGDGLSEQASVPQQLAQVTSTPVSKVVTYRPAVGPPTDVGNELSRQLNEAAAAEGIALVVDPAVRTELSLRGYVTALRKGTSVSITYLWDVLDPAGKRVNRITGEETLAHGVDVKQPWGAVTPAVSRAIAQRTMSDLGRWIKGAGAPTAGVSTTGDAFRPNSGSRAAGVGAPDEPR